MKEKIDGSIDDPIVNESWESIRYFTTLVRHGSLSAAARQLGVDHTTVGRRLRDMEVRLGATLFDRGPGKMTLSPGAREAAADALQIEGLMTDLLRRLQGADQRIEGEVRITSTHGIGVHWLVPKLQQFQDANPGVQIQLLVAYNRYSSLDAEADIALTWVRPQRPSSVTRKLAEVRCSLFAAPEYVSRYGLPRSVEEVSSHRLLYSDIFSLNESFAPWNRLMDCVRVPLTVKNSSTITPILMTGRYISLLPDYTSFVEPRLVRADIDLGVKLELWLSYDEQRRCLRRVRAVTEEIVRLAQADKGSWFL